MTMKERATTPCAMTVAESMPTTPQRNTAINRTLSTIVRALAVKFMTEYPTVSPKPRKTAEAICRSAPATTSPTTQPRFSGLNNNQTRIAKTVKHAQPARRTAHDAVTVLARSSSVRQSMRNRNSASSISKETAGTQNRAIVLM